jgi:hypothetical protein
MSEVFKTTHAEERGELLRDFSTLCVLPKYGRSIDNSLRMVVLICCVNFREMEGSRSLTQQHARCKSCLGWIYLVLPPLVRRQRVVSLRRGKWYYNFGAQLE